MNTDNQRALCWQFIRNLNWGVKCTSENQALDMHPCLAILRHCMSTHMLWSMAASLITAWPCAYRYPIIRYCLFTVQLHKLMILFVKGNVHTILTYPQYFWIVWIVFGRFRAKLFETSSTRSSTTFYLWREEHFKMSGILDKIKAAAGMEQSEVFLHFLCNQGPNTIVPI